MSWLRWADARSAAGALTLVTLFVAACGGSADPAVCSPPARVLESGGTHVLPGVEVTFEYSPPTSGPHQIPAPPSGVAEAPIAEPLQVAALEQGWVLLQYTTDADRADVDALAALASDGVIVAPGVRAFDDNATFAFTAWSRRQLCSALDLESAEAFIDTYQGVFFTPHE